MGIIVAFFLFIFAISIHYKERTWVSPGALFCYEWGIISLLASMRLFGLYEASFKTWMIILLGTISFLVGINFGKRLRIGNYAPVNTVNGEMYNPPFFGKRIFWIIVLVLLIYNVYLLSNTYVYIKMGYSLGEIRDANAGMINLTGFSRSSGIFNELISLLMNILEIFVVATGIEAFISDIKANWKMFVAVFAVEIVNAFSTGSRFTIAYLMVELLVCIGFYKHCGQDIGIQISRKTKKWVGRIVVLLLAILIWITLVRGAQTGQIVEKYYRYVCGNIVFLDLHIKELDDIGFWSMGYAGLFGFWSFVLPYFNALGISYPTIYLDTISKVFNTQTFIQIGTKMYTNAFISPFYHLYADYRWFGVVVGMFIFGGIVGKGYSRAVRESTHVRVIFYLVMCQMLFKTLQTYPFSLKPYFFAMIIILLHQRIRVRR